MPHILVAGRIHNSGVALLKQTPGFTFDLVDEVTTASYEPLIDKADALLIRTQPLPAEVIAKAEKLKIVSRHGVGFDAVDIAALNARHIPLTIVGDVNSRSVAEHTLMLMLAAGRQVVASERRRARRRLDRQQSAGRRQSGWRFAESGGCCGS